MLEARLLRPENGVKLLCRRLHSTFRVARGGSHHRGVRHRRAISDESRLPANARWVAEGPWAGWGSTPNDTEYRSRRPGGRSGPRERRPRARGSAPADSRRPLAEACRKAWEQPHNSLPVRPRTKATRRGTKRSTERSPTTDCHMQRGRTTTVSNWTSRTCWTTRSRCGALTKSGPSWAANRPTPGHLLGRCRPTRQRTRRSGQGQPAIPGAQWSPGSVAWQPSSALGADHIGRRLPDALARQRVDRVTHSERAPTVRPARPVHTRPRRSRACAAWSPAPASMERQRYRHGDDLDHRQRDCGAAMAPASRRTPRARRTRRERERPGPAGPARGDGGAMRRQGNAWLKDESAVGGVAAHSLNGSWR